MRRNLASKIYLLVRFALNVSLECYNALSPPRRHQEGSEHLTHPVTHKQLVILEVGYVLTFKEERRR